MKKMFSPHVTRISVFLLVIVGLLGGIFNAQYASSTAGQYTCNGQSMTEAQVAAFRGISPETLHLIKTQRGLTAPEICIMPQSKLDRAIFRANEPKPDKPGEALAFRKLQLQDENGFIPADGLVKADKQIKAMLAKQDPQSTISGITPAAWTWLGPGNIGGRVRAVAIHPTNTNTLWAGSVSGGIWKTTDAGVSWQVLDDFMSNMAVATLAIDPTNPDVLYAGTGEGFYNGDGIQGAGVFKTINGGATWTQLSATNTSDWFYVNRLAISPSGGVILAATSSGIWRSIDGGTIWTPVSPAHMLDINFDPTDSAKAVASSWGGGAWYSTDGGATWTKATFTGISGADRVEVAYAASSPSIVYASVDVNSGEVWKSTDGGTTYTRVKTGDSYLGGQGWYDNIIWVDPTNPNKLIVGGIDLWRSANGGATFTKISQWWSAPDSAHADNHIIIQDPGFNGTTNTKVYFGNDGGVYRANNVYTVAATTGWTELNNNLGITQFYGAAGNPTTGEIIGGTQDNGTLFYTPAGGAEGWTTPYGGDGGWSAADPTNPNYFYGEYVFLQIHRSSNRGIWSSDIYDGIADAGSCANFIAPFILDPNNANTMLAGGCSLWRSTNVKAATPSWASIKPPAAGSAISAIAVAPGNSAVIWVGHNTGDVYKTTNGTVAAPTWAQVDVNTPNLPDRYATRVTIDKNNADIVYVTFGGFSPDNVWRTTDGGLTWADITGSGLTGIPDVPVRSLVIHPDNSSWLYAGTELGIFTSENGGTDWLIPHAGPTNTSVDELFWMNTTLVAATHGRGLFKVNTLGLTCYTLTLAFTGSGSAPTANPTNSNGCSMGQYQAGEIIALTASPAAGWSVGSWIGTSNDASASTGNTVTMPGADHTVTANYVPAPLTFTSVAASDGWILESSEASNVGGTLSATSSTLRVGDDASNKQYLSILSFSTGAKLPDNAVITKVTLKVRISGAGAGASDTEGGNYVALFKGFMVDIKKGYFGTAALQTSDFRAAATKTYGPFSPAPSGGWYSMDLTAGKAYINKLSTLSGLTQIRLRFKLDDNNDRIAQYLTFSSGNASATLRPQFIIKYSVP